MEVLPASDTGITRALEYLQSGGVIAHATETCYGLACDLSNPKAVAKLFDIKKRSYDQPVSALFPSIDEAQKYVEFSPKALELAEKYLPGPLTLVLQRKKQAPSPLHVTPPSSSILNSQFSIPVGVRISSHPLAHELVLRFGKPIATTSANLHGHPNPYSPADIMSQFVDAEFLPDLILDSGVLPLAPASTVAFVDGEKVTVLRQGDLRV
jgi:L-threonylcarbamoyladenylate synthase